MSIKRSCKPGLPARRKQNISTRSQRVNWFDTAINVLVLELSRFACSTQRRTHKHKKQQQQQQENDTISFFLSLCLCLHRCVACINRDNARTSKSTSLPQLPCWMTLNVIILEALNQHPPNFVTFSEIYLLTSENIMMWHIYERILPPPPPHPRFPEDQKSPVWFAIASHTGHVYSHCCWRTKAKKLATRKVSEVILRSEINLKEEDCSGHRHHDGCCSCFALLRIGVFLLWNRSRWERGCKMPW